LAHRSNNVLAVNASRAWNLKNIHFCLGQI
jgi:hypothetical protein